MPTPLKTSTDMMLFFGDLHGDVRHVLPAVVAYRPAFEQASAMPFAPCVRGLT